MNCLLIFSAALCFAISSARASSQPDIYSTNFWEIEGKIGNVTWVEIHNNKEAQTNGVAHVSVITRQIGSPEWQIEWVCPHIAITTDALKRSVIRPFKTRGVYPENFYEAYDRWKEDEKKGKAIVCTTSIQDFLKTPKKSPQSSRDGDFGSSQHSYSLGMSRKEVRAELADSWLLVSASRPPAGWSVQVSPPAGGRAAMFEGSHPGAVEACDVYWVGHTNAPRIYSGKWLNYFYFDRSDKLIGFERWVME